MMRDDSRDILDSLLGQWHGWARNYCPVPTCGADPMFRMAKSSRHHMSQDEVIENEIDSTQMAAVDFTVGEMPEPHRSAIYAVARNAWSGAKVWSSPRLPVCPMERGVVIADARAMVTRKLIACGVM